MDAAYKEAKARIEACRKSGESGLSLSRLGLTQLPPEIFQLTGLTSLSLSRNHLTSLPPEIGLLTGLTSLSLYRNRLTSLPPEIGQLAGLTRLYLGGNRLTGLPPEIGQLTGLTRLSLGFNQLTSLPPEIRRLPGLDMSGLGDGSSTQRTGLTKEQCRRELAVFMIPVGAWAELICELYATLSALHEKCGGSGLRVSNTEIGYPARESVVSEFPPEEDLPPVVSRTTLESVDSADTPGTWVPFAARLCAAIGQKPRYLAERFAAAKEKQEEASALEVMAAARARLLEAEGDFEKARTEAGQMDAAARKLKAEAAQAGAGAAKTAAETALRRARIDAASPGARKLLEAKSETMEDLQMDLAGLMSRIRKAGGTVEIHLPHEDDGNCHPGDWLLRAL